MKLSTTVKTKSGHYVWVDTCWTFDHGYETMVFPCDERGNVTDWGDLDMSLYPSEAAAEAGHQLTCMAWEDMILNDNYEVVGAVI